MKKKIALILVLLAAAGLAAAAIYQGLFCLTGTARPEDLYAGDVPGVRSSVDADGDGVDDQTDILESALSYINTKPRYKSRYYETGWPDDGFGVCTDVVARALLGAGYDLMDLVAEDVLARGNEYTTITEPNPNIDFRRVRNLKVYFAGNAVTLTTDVHDTLAWQGGDVVIFANHIGIVSDRRNERGVPYVIHHNSPFQRAYEEDILESRSDIVGHYRVP